MEALIHRYGYVHRGFHVPAEQKLLAGTKGRVWGPRYQMTPKQAISVRLRLELFMSAVNYLCPGPYAGRFSRWYRVSGYCIW